MEKNNYELFDEQLDRYLRHDMTAEEEKEFKTRMDSDSELKQRAQLTALMIKSMYKSRYSDEEQKEDGFLVDAIKGMNEEQFRRIANPKIIRFWPKVVKYAVAACVAGVLVVGGYKYYDFRQTVYLGNSQYMAYVQDISDEVGMRGSNAGMGVDKLIGLFDNVRDGKNLKQTISELELLYEKSLNKDSEYYYYDDDIAWNLAIAYLKDGDKKKPIAILRRMIERNERNPTVAQPAQNLLDQIKNL